ncbi:MAG TPA: hypothetical protein VNF29_01585 [Candidatus Binataceae bacterium]|nr:hypothetical protein [Candidatus Binataceae bacterium]
MSEIAAIARAMQRTARAATARAAEVADGPGRMGLTGARWERQID